MVQLDNRMGIAQESSPAAKLSELRKTAGDYLSSPAVRLLARTSVTPDALSWFGLLLSLGAAALIFTGRLFAAGFAVLIAGFFDLLDGALARRTGRVTRFGAILDSTLDRVSEAALLLAVLVVYAEELSTLGVAVTGLALIGSYLVSYVRARAEAMSLECEVGLFTRPERVVILAVGLMLSRIDFVFLTVALGVIAGFSLVSAGQRLFYTWRQASK